MYIQRDIEKDLLHWKMHSSCALEIEGGRQIGKTTTIEKFVRENFAHVIYINLDEISGQHFMRVVEHCKQNCTAESVYLSIIETFAKQEGLIFSNSPDTVIVIDEIQKSQDVYEMIRPINRYLNCRLIVTGSYLSKAKNFFQPAGDTEKITMYPLNFLEFVDIWDGRAFLENQNLLNWDDQHDAWFSKAYLNYTILGGYPEVVTTAVESGNDKSAIGVAKDKIQRLISDELKYQFEAIEDKILLRQFMGYVLEYLLHEKVGRHYVKDLTSYVADRSGEFSLKTKEIKRCISWLLECGVLDTCDVHDFVTKRNDVGARIYFRDIGILHDLLDSVIVDNSTKAGFLTENFVFKTLNERFRQVPKFGLYNQGEIDFVVFRQGVCYGVEVKHGKNSGNTAIKLLQDRKIDKLIYFKGNAGSGVDNNTITLPVWAAAVCKYDFVEPKEPEEQLFTIDAFE